MIDLGRFGLSPETYYFTPMPFAVSWPRVVVRVPWCALIGLFSIFLRAFTAS